MSQSLERALQALEDLADGPVSIGEIARRLDVHHSTALRMLHTLRSRDFVDKQEDGRYRLASGLFSLGFRALEQIDLRTIAAPHIRALSERTTETVHLGVIEKNNVVYIDKVESHHPVRMYSRVGILAPLYCTGIGKVILAFLDEDRREQLVGAIPFERHTDRTLITPDQLREDLDLSHQRGFARDDEEHETGIHCVAAPLFGVDGSVVGAISLSAPTSRVDRERLLSFVPDLLEHSAAISSELGSPDRGLPDGSRLLTRDLLGPAGSTGDQLVRDGAPSGDQPSKEHH